MLTGANDTHIATLVERYSRFTMLVKLKRKDPVTFVAALVEQIGKLPVTRALPWLPTSRPTSALRAVPSSEAVTKTPTASSDSTSQRNRLVPHLTKPVERHRPAAQSTAPENLGLRNTRR